MKLLRSQIFIFIIFASWIMVAPFLIPAQIPTGYAYTYQYSVNSYVRYEINYEIDFTAPIGFSNFKVWIARFQNQSGQKEALQEVKVKIFPTPIGIDVYDYDPWDIYNNSYDFYEKAFSFSDHSFHFSITYDVTLNGASWDIPSNITIANYDINSDLYKFYTGSQPYCESNDSGIIDRADQIAGNYDGIVEKARAIYLYVVQSMQYQVLDQAIGAKNASLTLIGDCSEFSSLMVALLRAQGIPARKVLGFGLVTGDIESPEPLYSPQLGQTLNYSYQSGNLPGHAWVQYYVPNYGWVTADPTWGQSFYNAGSTTTQKEQLALEYFNRIDYNHLISTIGDWYGSGIDPAIASLFTEGGLAEFPYAVLYGAEAGTFNIKLNIKVLDFHLGSQGTPLSEFYVWALVGGSGALILVLLFVAYNKRRRSMANRY